ncbi:MAG: hypothetical protein IT384_19575 [Deltaproteobacteria bacterium]|nr:hypothetical protein [Deltaproteobacteria bacterium]
MQISERAQRREIERIEVEPPRDPHLEPAPVETPVETPIETPGEAPVAAAERKPRGRRRRLASFLAGAHRGAVLAVMLGTLALGGVVGAPLAHAEEPASPPAITAPAHAGSSVAPETSAIAPHDSASSRDALRRAPLEIELAPTFGSTTAHASHYALGPRALGLALDGFTDRYPELDRTFAARFLQLAGVFGLEVPWMVLSHEGGHYRVARELGWKPEIEMTGWMSGLTHYHPDPTKARDPAAELAAAAAGVNQEQLNAAYLYRDWARNGTAHWTEAMAYLLAQTNTGLYAARSAMRGEDTPSSDDIAAYTAGLNARGHAITRGQLAALALGADLLSAPVWATLIGEVRYLAGGGRRIEIPTLKLGSIEATFPNFHTYLDSDGPIVGGHLLINPKAKIPVEISVDTRVTGGGTAIGAKLYDVPLAPDLSLNPFVRVTSSERNNGVRVGTDLQYALSENVLITGTVAAGTGDLLREVEGKKDGVDFSIKLGLRF